MARRCACFAIHIQMNAQRLGDLEADREGRVEAGRRLLEDHRHVLAGELAAFVVGQRQEIVAVEAHAVGAETAGIGDEAHQREHRHAFARAGFADDAEHLAMLDAQRHAIDRAQRRPG